MQTSIHVALTFLWTEPKPISKNIAYIEAASAEHIIQSRWLCQSNLHLGYFTIPLCDSKSSH